MMSNTRSETDITYMEGRRSYDYVLIIDDSELDLFITERLLRNTACIGELKVTQNPLEALGTLKLAKSAAEMPDLIILDIRMPGFDGFAFLKALSGFPDHLIGTCEVMILSAYFEMEPELIARTKVYPFVKRYLKKPFDVQQFNS